MTHPQPKKFLLELTNMFEGLGPLRDGFWIFLKMTVFETAIYNMFNDFTFI